MLLLAVLIASLVGVASWAVKERDRRLALTADNARLASENGIAAFWLEVRGAGLWVGAGRA